MKPHFGPAGAPEGFYQKGFSSSVDMPEYLAGMGLDAFEYQCGKGVNIGRQKARLLGERAGNYGIAMSLHSPYYISLASPDPQKRENSIGYILDSAVAVREMGGNRVVVHSGALGGLPREDAVALAGQTLKQAYLRLEEAGLSDIALCPETMGKINQLGTLDEVIYLCSLDERMIPTVDFGHINARTLGGLKTFRDFEEIFERIENALGSDRMRSMHIHFSKIEYTRGGEKQHLTFADTRFGPDFEPVAELIYKKGCYPMVICESDGTQDVDALAMKRMYESL